MTIEPGKHFWFVLVVEAFTPNSPEGFWRRKYEPRYYLPVFETREEADRWAQGHYEVREIRIAAPDPDGRPRQP